MDLGFKMNWSIVRVITGRRGVSSERRRSSCSSFINNYSGRWSLLVVESYIRGSQRSKNTANRHLIFAITVMPNYQSNGPVMQKALPCHEAIMVWTSYQKRKIARCACAGNAGKRFPRHWLQKNPLLTIPACVTAHASRTCRDACRDR